MAGVRVVYEQIASPGHIHHVSLKEPKTLSEWQTKAAEALSSKGNFVLGVEKEPEKEILINVLKVVNVVAE